MENANKKYKVSKETMIQAQVAIEEFVGFMATHKNFPSNGPICHVLSCKALEYFKLRNVEAKLVCFNPKRLKEVKYPNLAPNHVWVEIVGIGYYDASFDELHSYTNNPYGDPKLFSKPKYDKLEQIVGPEMVKHWER